ncbi:unnamed protein product [Closterium sp. Naga37s-1]|nr:unnamed protein product [Closterium sp. Naga37s-1]
MYAVGARIWVKDEEEAFVEAVVTAVDGDAIEADVIGRKGPLAKAHLKASECHHKEEDLGLVDDMTKLAHLHEPGVLHNLATRYQKNLIYTYTGSILIAVNPFVRLPALYHPIMKLQYRGAQLGELGPHVFAIADHAYRSMLDTGQSQSVLISGESGAGKTETTKLVMEYLAGLGDTGHDNSKGAPKNEAMIASQLCVSRVLESNQLLESFGNAKTVRNNNSSRFGKFIEIQFDADGCVSGAAIRSYLLERSRVVQISDPERSYHCFYQLIYGATPEEAELFKLPTTGERGKQFRYLNQSECFELPDSCSNAEEYRKTRHAMEVMGFTLEEQMGILRLLAAILHLGNVLFQEGDDPPPQLAGEQSDFHLTTVAELLGVPKEPLLETLVTYTRKVGREVFKSPLKPQAAAAKRDTLVKTLYSKLFDWIVAKVNESIGQDPTSTMLIGVLDIYGFEHFKTNSFEQFCINLANEKLQQHFNAHVLKMEQEEYTREEIDWSYVDFTDNEDVLELIEGKQGILSTLDSTCKTPNSTPETFSRTLYKQYEAHERFLFGKMSKTDFTIHHYAGQVKYLTDEFLVKNMDAVVPEHEELLGHSDHAYIAQLFPLDAEASKAAFNSLGKRFKEQLAALMRTLNSTAPHYIRCVKPNSTLKPGVFTRTLVMEQLRSGGVLEAVRVCSKGYPTRRSFEDFIDRFAFLVPSSLYDEAEDDELVRAIMKEAGIQGYQIGLTKVFLRAGQMVVLETMRLNRMAEAARTIQKYFRAYLFRLHRKQAALTIQNYWRGFKAREQLRELREFKAAQTIQKYTRRWMHRRRFLDMREAQIRIAAHVRMHQARTHYIFTRRTLAATKIQATWRGYHLRKPYWALRRRLQVRLGQRRLTRMKEAAARAALLAPPRTKVEASLEQLRLKVLRLMKTKEEKKRKELQEQLDIALKEVEAKAKENAQLTQRLKEEAARAHRAEEELRSLIGHPDYPGGAGGASHHHQSGLPHAFSRGGAMHSPSVSRRFGKGMSLEAERAGGRDAKGTWGADVAAAAAASIAGVEEGGARGEGSGSELEISTTRASGLGFAARMRSPRVGGFDMPGLGGSASVGGAEGRGPIQRSKAWARVKARKGDVLQMSDDPDMATAAAVSSAMGAPNAAWGKMFIQIARLNEELEKLKEEKAGVEERVKEERARMEGMERKVEAYEGTLQSQESLIKEMQGKMKELQEKLKNKDEEVRELSWKLLDESIEGRSGGGGQQGLGGGGEAGAAGGEEEVLSRPIAGGGLQIAVPSSPRISLPPMSSHGPPVSPNKLKAQLEDRLLTLATTNMYGFSEHGHPIAMCTLYKALDHWKTFEAARTNTFDRIIEALQLATHTGSLQMLGYWLSNTATLLCLLETTHTKRVQLRQQSGGGSGWFAWGGEGAALSDSKSAVDLTLFKTQLRLATERIYVTVRDSINNELQGHFGSGHLVGQTPRKASATPTPRSRRSRGGSSGGDRSSLPRSAGSMRRQMLDYWGNVLETVGHMVAALEDNHVPVFLIQHVLRQLLSYVDLRVFNSLMVRSQWCPCNFSNGETIEEGMGKLDRWLTDLEMSHAKRAQGELPGLKDSLCHVRQAALLLTMKNKHRATVDDVRKLCPDLNGKQLGKICLWYQDEKYGTLGFDPDVNYELSDLADDDDAEMLKDDESYELSDLADDDDAEMLKDDQSELADDDDAEMLKDDKNNPGNSVIPTHPTPPTTTPPPYAPPQCAIRHHGSSSIHGGDRPGRVASMGEINLEEVPLPPELRRDPHFRFLQPTPANEPQQPPKVPATKSVTLPTPTRSFWG